MVKSKRVVWRLLMLATLMFCLFYVSADRDSGAASLATCVSCDQNFGMCEGNCYSAYWQCRINYPETYCYPILDTCRDGCFDVYSNCIGTCTYESGGGGGGSTCGLGKTPCELDCRNARGQCVQAGGTNCGQEFQSCVEACCS